MSRFSAWVAGVAATGLVMAGTAMGQVPAAAADEGGVEVTAELPVFSAYVWRGQVLNDEAVVQPYLEVYKNGFGISVWGNFNLTENITEADEFCEVDLNLFYEVEQDGVQLEMGLYEYLYPHWNTEVQDVDAAGMPIEGVTHTEPVPGTREVYLRVGYELDIVTPKAEVYYDIDEVDGFYADVGLEKEIEVGEKDSGWTVTPAVKAGWASSDYNSYYFGVDDSALNDASVSLGVGYDTNEAVSWKATLAYTWMLDNDIKDAAKEVFFDDSLVWGGVTMAYAF